MHSRKPVKSVDKSQSMEIYSNDSVIYGNRMRKTGGGARTVGGFNFGLKNRPIVGPLSLSCFANNYKSFRHYWQIINSGIF